MANGTIMVDMDTYSKLMASGKMPQTAMELERALEGDIDQYQQETLTFCGTPYEFGGKQIQPMRGLATLACLEAIDSPFLNPDNDEASFDEVAMTLYIIQGGAEVAKRIMGIRRRLRGMAKLERWAQKDADMFGKYLEAQDRIRAEYAPIEAEAVAWANTLDNVTLDDCVTFIFIVLKDAWGGLEMIPNKGGAGKIEKKSLTGTLKRWLGWPFTCIKRLAVLLTI